MERVLSLFAGRIEKKDSVTSLTGKRTGRNERDILRDRNDANFCCFVSLAKGAREKRQIEKFTRRQVKSRISAGSLVDQKNEMKI